ncbi:MAG: RibD family protein [Planctomycetes bacterium]|nr:RibD family protein [Planctomycetota bacterium]
MACELADDTSWPAFLSARALLRSGVQELVFAHRGSDWSCEAAGDADLRDARQVLSVSVRPASLVRPRTMAAECAWTVYSPRDNGLPDFVHADGRPVCPTMIAMARVYLPVLLLAAAARAEGRTFVAGHVTQTLDGRIACENGQSQWIGNEADLRHAHRMRALLDGVLVGAGTALTDDPRLTVRHVPGADPHRIVLSGSGRVLRAGRALRVFDPPGGTAVIAAHATVDAPPNGARVVRVVADGPALDPAAVLAAVHAIGVQSLYLEGGARALSSFLLAGSIDLLQVHIAAMVLGSGIPSFRLPPVAHVRDGVPFAVDHALLDGHVLLSCRPRPKANATDGVR